MCRKQVCITFTENLLLKVHLLHSGTESLSFLGTKIWDLVPVELKQSESLDSLKLKIKNWMPCECPYRLWKTYIQQVGFLSGNMIPHAHGFYHFYNLCSYILYIFSLALAIYNACITIRHYFICITDLM